MNRMEAVKNLSHMIKTSKTRTPSMRMTGAEEGPCGEDNKFVIGTNLDYFK